MVSNNDTDPTPQTPPLPLPLKGGELLPPKNVWKLTGLSAAMHFLVDALCVCCLYQMAGTFSVAGLLGVFMAYNVLAFLTQPLTGMLADRMAARTELLLGGAVGLLALGVAWASLVVALCPQSLAGMLTASVLLGMGNSLFHVWGGKLTAVASGNDARVLGVFVSTGAFGLAVGVLFHSWWLLYALFALLCVLFPVALRLRCHALPHPEKQDSVGQQHNTLAWMSMLLLMGLVMLRSFVGETFTTGMTRTGFTALAIGLVAMAGKMAGGWMVKWMGIFWAFATVVAIVLLCLFLRAISGEGTLWAGLLTVNLTMAMTLYLANRAMRGREGLAFGLLASALMPGYLIALFGTTAAQTLPAIAATLLPTIAIEAGVLWLLREHRADVLWSSVVVNMLTNVPLNLYLTFVGNSVGTLLVAEVIVVVVEMLWYRYFVRSLRMAFAYSILANGMSFLLGLLVQLLLIYFGTTP